MKPWVRKRLAELAATGRLGRRADVAAPIADEARAAARSPASEASASDDGPRSQGRSSGFAPPAG